MSYTAERMDAGKALEHIGEYPYALVYGMSGITFCRTADLKEPDWDECLEARFFGEDKEMHLYGEEGEWRAVRVTGTMDEDCLVRKYALQDRYFGPGKYLCVCEHLEYDEDGQASVALTRLMGIA
ncbi:MAG: hypothetical protein NC121_06115 [Blautia sp.]|nr:hypothetical protein [Blautia sp.]